MAAAYSLLKHVFLCLCDEKVVILDLRDQRYRALDAKKMSGLASIVPGWPTLSSAREEAGAAAEEEREAVARALVEQGILADNPAAGKNASPIVVRKPLIQILPDADEQAARPDVRSVVALTSAFVAAALRVRFCSLQRMTQWANQTQRSLRARGQPLEMERARMLVRIYTHLRPLFFGSRDACLFESLVLLGFLARHGIHVDWVFGVRLRPWLAHCWLQRDGVALSDTTEHIDLFTPIMAVGDPT